MPEGRIGVLAVLQMLNGYVLTRENIVAFQSTAI